MKNFLFLILFFLCCFSSCDKPKLTDEEIFSKVERCKSFGLKPLVFRNYWRNTYIYNIQCSGEIYVEKKEQNINQVCIDGYKYIKNSNGTFTQMFKKVEYVSGLGLPKGDSSLPVECD